MSKLVDMALGQTIEPPNFDLNMEPLGSLDVDERPPLIVKLVDPQLLAIFLMNNQWSIRVYSYIHIETTCHMREVK